MLIIAHSDDFRWFGPLEKLDEWELIIATFNTHKYEVRTITTDKEFVGIVIVPGPGSRSYRVRTLPDPTGYYYCTLQ